MFEENKMLHKFSKISITRILLVGLPLLALIGLLIYLLVQKQHAVPTSVTVSEASTESNSETATPTLAIKRPHDPKNIIRRNGICYYLEEEGITSKFGIDISSHQGVVDWQMVKEAGVDFAIIRAGYRGNSEGKLQADETFHQNMKGAKEAGIEVGVYFFSQAITVEEALEEANFTLAMIKGYDFTYPVVFDWEFIVTEPARTDNISKKDLTNCTVAFCDAIAEAGYTPMVYQSKATSLTHLDLKKLKDYEFWLAEYNDEISYQHNYDMWQYTDSGVIPGITGEVDLNICFKDYTLWGE